MPQGNKFIAQALRFSDPQWRGKRNGKHPVCLSEQAIVMAKGSFTPRKRGDERRAWSPERCRGGRVGPNVKIPLHLAKWGRGMIVS